MILFASCATAWAELQAPTSEETPAPAQSAREAPLELDSAKNRRSAEHQQQSDSARGAAGSSSQHQREEPPGRGLQHRRWEI